MLFNSFKFILFFLPAFFLSYFLITDKYKNHIILAYSLIFYFFACFDNIGHLFLLIISIVINYMLVHIIYRLKGNIRLFVFILTIAFNLIILIYFKYFNFIIDVLRRATSTIIGVNSTIATVTNAIVSKTSATSSEMGNRSVLDAIWTSKGIVKNIVLPLGISFYTMQIISYIVDVYKGDIESEKNFVDFATYVLMFSQLIAGPILRYKDIKCELKNKNIYNYEINILQNHKDENNFQIKNSDNIFDRANHRDLNWENIFIGINYFVFGLSSKVICANLLSYIQIDVGDNILDFSTCLSWLSAGAFMLQLYFDFNGYSMMAKGLCKMMGINILDNFNDPLMSKSVTEFWRRWHISLSIFLKDYIYIPLGGSRKGTMRTLINLFVVFLISGIWHGANYSFIIFGLLFAFFMIIERIFLYKLLDKTRIIGHIYLLMVVFMIFVFFAHEDLNECILYIKNMFLFGGKFYTNAVFDVIRINYKAIIIGIAFATNLPHIIYSYISKNVKVNVVVVVLLFILDLYVIYLGYNDPFMYFRF